MKRFILMTIIALSCLSIMAQETKDSTAEMAAKTTVVSGNWSATYYGNTYKSARRNANGEPFNMNAMTCAAPKKFPFGTRLKVTNTANGKSVIVRVCDRCVGQSIIDLTYGAFGKIASHRSGRVNVKVEIVK